MTTQPETPTTQTTAPLVIEGVPDVVACEVRLPGCDGEGFWTAWAREVDPQRCCAACGGQMAGRPGVMVFPVVR